MEVIMTLTMPLKYVAKYIIFVDFDGVLTSNRVHMAQPIDSYPMWSTFDPIVTEFFNKIHNTYKDVRFVWTTSWRNNVKDQLLTEHWAYSMWYNAGFRGLFGDPWRVNPDSLLPYNDRAKEIADYLDNYAADCDDYIILDDTDYGFNKVLPKKRFINTSPTDGMLYKNMLNMSAMMGLWDKK